MGYFLINHQIDHKPIVVAALMKFQQSHTIEMPPRYEVDLKRRTVRISAGETETYTFEELGFS